jgi:hypothetical protein
VEIDGGLPGRKIVHHGPHDAIDWGTPPIRSTWERLVERHVQSIPSDYESEFSGCCLCIFELFASLASVAEVRD